MSNKWVVLCVAFACVVAGGVSHGEKHTVGEQAKAPLKVAVVTGGHSYDEQPFLNIFEGLDGLDCVHLDQKDDSEIFDNIENWPYDVVVLYCMGQNIPDNRKENLVKLLDKGVGLVALHHTVAAFSTWDEFAAIIGTKFFLEAGTWKGAEVAQSTYKHDVDFTISVADKQHPITQGLSDFTIHDETYKGCHFAPDNHVLLTTDEATSDKPVAWTRTYRKARVCSIQMGHDAGAFKNGNYRLLVERAIRWTGRGLEDPERQAE